MIVYSTKEICYRRFKAIQDEIIIIRIPIAKQLEIKKKKKGRHRRINHIFQQT